MGTQLYNAAVLTESGPQLRNVTCDGTKPRRGHQNELRQTRGVCKKSRPLLPRHICVISTSTKCLSVRPISQILRRTPPRAPASTPSISSTRLQNTTDAAPPTPKALRRVFYWARKIQPLFRMRYGGYFCPPAWERFTCRTFPPFQFITSLPFLLTEPTTTTAQPRGEEVLNRFLPSWLAVPMWLLGQWK